MTMHVQSAGQLALCSLTTDRTDLNAVASFLPIHTFNNIFRYKATTIPRLTNYGHGPGPLGEYWILSRPGAFSRLRSGQKKVEVNQRALVDKVLARYPEDFTGSWRQTISFAVGSRAPSVSRAITEC
jgi:hypothetical protein